MRLRFRRPARARGRVGGTGKGRGRGDVLRCSFCGKPRDRVRKIIAGPGVYICNECVELCVEIMAEEDRR